MKVSTEPVGLASSMICFITSVETLFRVDDELINDHVIFGLETKEGCYYGPLFAVINKIHRPHILPCEASRS